VGFYSRHILPHFLDMACGAKPISRQRQKVVPLAEGRVLEIGIGSGLNLPFYDPAKVERVFGLDPAEEMLRIAQKRDGAVPFPVEYLALEEGTIPLEAASIDTVLITYTLCTIPEPVPALDGLRPLLKPGGRLIFCEHGKAPDAGVERWQSRLDPLWGRIAGGCHLGRDIPAILTAGGFRLGEVESMYLPKTPRFAGFNYWGTALPG
jgi:ubiquinone/menaquinone biosynthesis C-methylase UbiE